jgi:hypothetical protein
MICRGQRGRKTSAHARVDCRRQGLNADEPLDRWLQPRVRIGDNRDVRLGSWANAGGLGGRRDLLCPTLVENRTRTSLLVIETVGRW